MVRLSIRTGKCERAFVNQATVLTSVIACVKNHSTFTRLLLFFKENFFSVVQSLPLLTSNTPGDLTTSTGQYIWHFMTPGIS
jgi:hypothetical protein